MGTTIAVLPGDGVGPEVTREACRTLAQVGRQYGQEFEFNEQRIGGVAIDATGKPLPEATLRACRHSDAVLLGAVGGPQWDDHTAAVRPEQGLLGLRKTLGLFANLRPVKVHPALASASPLKEERLARVDVLVVRELTGGIYFGEPRLRETVNGTTRAVDTMVYTDVEVRRVLQLAFRLAERRRQRVVSVDKANVLESSRLWREVAEEVAGDFPDVAFENQLVDAAAMRLMTSASSFDVLVTGNLFGDILTDEASVLAGSLGMLPSASLGEGRLGLYEPVHGSAPDIAGKDLANPTGAILSAAMLLRHSLELEQAAVALEAAVHRAIASGARTQELGGTLTCTQMGSAIRDCLGG